MEEQSFTLNNRFIVKPSLGIIRDAQTGKETRIEPRLMSLLCLLAENHEQLVARPVITKQIWDDYGNADEGLTQAISYLRKVLADDEKILIETVPKKGYVLHAKLVYNEPQNENLEYVHGARRGKFMLIAAVIFVLVVALFFIFKSRQEQKQGNPDTIRPGQNTHAGDTTTKDANPDRQPDTVKPAQSGADKVK
jgi:DNA-binding winged helix-turn-helix (wHTH) protein